MFNVRGKTQIHGERASARTERREDERKGKSFDSFRVLLGARSWDCLSRWDFFSIFVKLSFSLYLPLFFCSSSFCLVVFFFFLFVLLILLVLLFLLVLLVFLLYTGYWRIYVHNTLFLILSHHSDDNTNDRQSDEKRNGGRAITHDMEHAALDFSLPSIQAPLRPLSFYSYLAQNRVNARRGDTHTHTPTCFPSSFSTSPPISPCCFSTNHECMLVAWCQSLFSPLYTPFSTLFFFFFFFFPSLDYLHPSLLSFLLFLLTFFFLFFYSHLFNSVSLVVVFFVPLSPYLVVGLSPPMAIHT